MPRPLATEAPPAPPRLGGVPLRSVAVPAGIAISAIAITQVYGLWVRGLSINESYVGYLGVQAALLGLLILGLWLERRSARDAGFLLGGPLAPVLLLSAVLVMIYVAVRVDAGFIYGFGRLPPPPPWLFGYLLLSAPLAAVAEAGLFFGYLLRAVSRMLPLPHAILVCAVAFALYSTNFTILPSLSPTTGAQYLFSTTLVDFVLGIVLAFYSYKSRWSLVGPVAFLSGVLALDSLLPIVVSYPTWEVAFVVALIAQAFVLVVVGLSLREPRLQSLRYLRERIGPRRYRFRRRARDRLAAQGLLVSTAVVGVAAISISIGLPAVLGTSQPLLAIETGSMVPTFSRGTLVLVSHVAPGAISVGTIIVFSVGCLPSPTVHRVIKIVSTGPNWVYQTKGDANPTQDPCTVPYSDVRGEVIGSAPYLGFLVLDPLLPGALIALMVIVAVVWQGARR